MEKAIKDALQLMGIALDWMIKTPGINILLGLGVVSAIITAIKKIFF